MRSAPSPARISSTACAAEAWLWGASTRRKPEMSAPAFCATASILRRGPTRIGTMMPSPAASTAPSSEVSSQGCTTTVGAAGRSLVRSISCSYLAWVCVSNPLSQTQDGVC